MAQAILMGPVPIRLRTASSPTLLTHIDLLRGCDDTGPLGASRLTACLHIDRKRKAITQHRLRPEPEQRIWAKDSFQVPQDPQMLLFS